MGFTGLALSALLGRSESIGGDATWSSPNGKPHFPPRAKSVIWIFLCGGLSHVESFDVKPALNRYAGKSIEETPFAGVLKSAEKEIIGGNPNHGNRKVIMPLQTGYKSYGQSGLVVSDWFPHVASCADDLAVVRSLWTNDNDHGAQLTWHTGRHVREGGLPTVGSWACYGLGALNANLPEYVVLGTPTGDCCGGAWTHGAGYLGPEHAGVRMSADPAKPLPFLSAGPNGPTREEQLAGLSLLGKLNTLSGIDYPDDRDLRARLKSYELAFQMQTAVPETLEIEKESDSTRKLYGLDQSHCAEFGRLCLTARRLVERGVRFVQIFHGGGGGGAWDAHSGIKANHSQLAAQVDQPVAGLLKDLKSRGLFADTTVVCGTEFGRTPGAQDSGRDHHPQGFSAWLAGAGIKGGIAHGATDEIGFHAIQDRHYVTDIHATVLHLLGLDSHRLELPGRRRLELDHGEVISEILA
ncbi:MAG: DUF1501 domain-containing protein [Verrucomicrobiales bacterium]